MSNELKSCPFCGGEAYVHEHYSFQGRAPKDYPHNKPIGYAVGCTTFDCRGKRENTGFMYKTEAEAVEAWNTRHVETCHAESDLSEWVCSECQCWIPLGLTPENIKHASEWRYCPHCGRRVKP